MDFRLLLGDNGEEPLRGLVVNYVAFRVIYLTPFLFKLLF